MYGATLLRLWRNGDEESSAVLQQSPKMSTTVNTRAISTPDSVKIFKIPDVHQGRGAGKKKKKSDARVLMLWLVVEQQYYIVQLTVIYLVSMKQILFCSGLPSLIDRFSPLRFRQLINLFSFFFSYFLFSFLAQEHKTDSKQSEEGARRGKNNKNTMMSCSRYDKQEAARIQKVILVMANKGT